MIIGRSVTPLNSSRTVQATAGERQLAWGSAECQCGQLGDPQLTTTPNHPRGAMLRAYDKNTGREVRAIWMPAPQSGSPMTYMLDGKQYIVVAISGGIYSGEYLAFRLPD